MSKFGLILMVIFGIMAFFLKSFYEDKQVLKRENSQLMQDKARLSAELAANAEESNKRLKAFEEREISLINDRKELQNEYEKLLELKQSDACYLSWGDGLLPDSVSILLQ